jgi:hypothetical protein
MTMNTASPDQSSVLGQSSECPHTPGPWTVGTSYRNCVFHPNGTVAECLNADDAPFIAAAPSMFKILSAIDADARQYLQKSEAGTAILHRDTLEEVRRILAIAAGRSGDRTDSSTAPLAT